MVCLTSVQRLCMALATALLAGCASPLAPDVRGKLDGLVLYGWVNRTNDDAAQSSLASPEGQKLCALGDYAWCKAPGRYTYISVMLMNSYWGGLMGVGVYAPNGLNVRPNDIVVIRFRADRFSELLRVASRGERDDCRWVGGGIARTTTLAGVVCEDYDWRRISAKLER